MEKYLGSGIFMRYWFGFSDGIFRWRILWRMIVMLMILILMLLIHYCVVVVDACYVLILVESAVMV